LIKTLLLIRSGSNASRRASQGWRIYGDRKIFMRSKWEANYGRYLQWQKEHGKIKDWEHEPYIFRFEGLTKGCTTYKPDFKVIELDGSHYWVEVKGYYDQKSITKLKRLALYYPQEKIKTVDKKWFKRNNERMRIIIKGWE